LSKRLDKKLLARLETLRQLEIFLQVAEAGSIAKAAEILNLMQPSVSIQVKKLCE
jgi:DNA-binding transcriptional LysR family regulator